MVYNINCKRIKCNSLWVLLPILVYAHMYYTVYNIYHKNLKFHLYTTQIKQTVPTI